MIGDFWHHEQIAANMSFLWYFDYFQHVTLHGTETAVKVIDSCVLVVSRITRQAGMSETEMAKIYKASASHCPRPQTWICTYSPIELHASAFCTAEFMVGYHQQRAMNTPICKIHIESLPGPHTTRRW